MQTSKKIDMVSNIEIKNSDGTTSNNITLKIEDHKGEKSQIVVQMTNLTHNLESNSVPKIQIPGKNALVKLPANMPGKTEFLAR